MFFELNRVDLTFNFDMLQKIKKANSLNLKGDEYFNKEKRCLLDLQCAFQFYLQSTKVCDVTQAWNNLGECYFHGMGAEKDLKKAHECFIFATFDFVLSLTLLDKNKSNAWLNLGKSYLEKAKLEKSKIKSYQYNKEAYNCFCKALKFDNQNDIAGYKLYDCYLNGIGVEKNVEKATEYLKLAKPNSLAAEARDSQSRICVF